MDETSLCVAPSGTRDSLLLEASGRDWQGGIPQPED